VAVSDLTSAAQDYLKVIWASGEWSSTPVTTKLIAERLGVRPPSVSDAVRRLTEQGLVTHERYGTVELTDEGRAHAVAMVRRHRLIETFLVQVLGYGWDEVHDEAEVLEHAVSDTMIARIDERLGHPVRDPHGDPIPSADGDPRRPDARLLTGVEPGTAAVVARISDSDPGLLRYFAEVGLGLDARITVLEALPFTGTMTVLVAGEPVPVQLGAEATDAVWVTL